MKIMTTRHRPGDVDRPHTPRRAIKRSALAVAAAAALAAGMLGASPVVAAEGDDLGPTLVETGAAPSGYAMQFRYAAPEGVQQVHVYGDWTYSQPENVTCDGCGDGRLPSQWQPGDVAATQWRTIPMVKGADDVWEVTVPLPAGTFRYAFTHDCTSNVATNCALNYDPANPWEIFPQYPGAPGAVRSTTWVPANPAFPTYATDYQKPLPDAQLGTLESVRYASPLSTTPAGVHDMVVYTPFGYDPNRAEPYKTLYLSHGSGDHSTAWTMQGVAHHIVQNAINDGSAEEMVVVSTDFNGLPGGNNGYVNELRNNVIPYIETNYNVSTTAIDRAFAGFSAGGSRAATILYDNTDLFGYHGVWSIAPGNPTAAQLERLKNVEGAIMMGTGLQDRLGNIATGMVNRQAQLIEAGVDIDAYNVPGGHTWHVWRPLLDHYVRDVIFPAPPDTTKPVATLVSPTTAGPFPALSVRVDATDDRGLQRIVANIYKGSTLVKSTQSASGGAKSATHQATVTLPDGAYTVKYNAQDLAGNIASTGTFAFTIDATKPTATIKDGASFTVKTGETYDLISFKLHDAGQIDKVVLNGVVKDLTNNAWSDVNFIKPGVFGGVQGANTLVVHDVAGNTETYTFTLN